MKYEKVSLIDNYKISSEFYEMSFKWEDGAKPGQFFMISERDPGETLLKRPISIHGFKDGIVKILYRVAGKGTKKLSNLKKNEEINVLGPLGNGFNTEFKDKNIAIVCGGIGMAPMAYLAQELKENNLHIYLGFKDEVFIPEAFKAFEDNIHIATETGKIGSKGFVTDILDVKNYDVVYTCGPEIMMKKIALMCRENGVKCFVSLEGYMGCGVGACLSCVCDTKYGKKKICKEGPVFEGDEVWI